MTGEIEELLESIKSDAQGVLRGLAGVEDDLLTVKNLIEAGNTQGALQKIDEIRVVVGNLEHLDQEYYQEADTAENLVFKLKDMVEKCI